jgi:hypothetical protein
MALRPAPKRKSVDYQKLDDLQKEIFGSENEENKTPLVTKTKGDDEVAEQNKTEVKARFADKSDRNASAGDKTDIKPAENKAENKKTPASQSDSSEKNPASSDAKKEGTPGEHLSDLETIAARIVSSKAGQGRNTTRPFSLPRTLIIDTTRLKSKFRTIDEQFTQNVIIDFLLREALSAVTPENYKDLRAGAFEYVKRAGETTRRSLTVTEEVIYQMSELKAGINLETGRKYSNDEILSTLLALGVSWLYRNNVLT